MNNRKKQYKHYQFKGITGTMKNGSFEGARRTQDAFLGSVDIKVKASRNT